MAVHHPHLLDFSAPPTALPMEAPLPAFNNDGGLLGLHADMQAGGEGVLAGADDTAAPWPHDQAVSLSLLNYNTAGASLVGHHQPFTAAPNHQLQNLQPFQLIRSSKYLGPVKELLGEFCSLEGDDLLHAMANKRAPNKAGKWDDVEPLSSGLWGSPSLSSMDLMELERRKIRLLSMVEEVDRRYRRYREQMRSVEASFEAVAGAGAAQVYTRLALRAMSRHFRCLRDALVAQVRAVRKAMGGGENNDGGATPAGASKGDTPRLKVLDQCLRQQRAFQQHPAVDNYPPWRPQRGLPERAVAVLRAWLFEHFLHPYPNDVDKQILARKTGLSRSQVSNWFINARVRLWKPMIEEMYTEEVKQQSEGNQNPICTVVKAERSTTATSIGGESYQFGALGDPSNSMISSSTVTDGGNHLFHNGYPNLHGSHSTVSLTLGLQQQSFASLMMQQQRSAHILEGDHEQHTVLPYRNLMASQSLHDLAG
ncbi:hypothetical protein EJB05_46643, partial [Eragrostis curvula]